MLAFAPLDGAVGAAHAALSVLITAVTPVAGVYATAIAIILFTVAVRLVLSPLSYAQIAGERRRAALAPRIRELQRRYREDRERLQREMSALYRSEGGAMFAGCLPALLQAPYFFVMYQLFTRTPDLANAHLFGVTLAHHVGDGLAGAAGPVFAAVFVLLAVLAWWSSRRVRRTMAVTADIGGDVAGGQAVGRVVRLLPYATLLVALFVPLAACLYLVTTTAWTAVEQAVLRGILPA